jgi:hypothetical protein
MSKFGSGATVTSSDPSSAICVLQARQGRPLIIIPHEPQIPIRQEKRQARPGSAVSLIFHSPSSTVIPGSASIR